jgi:hypothetical protein
MGSMEDMTITPRAGPNRDAHEIDDAEAAPLSNQTHRAASLRIGVGVKNRAAGAMAEL